MPLFTPIFDVFQTPYPVDQGTGADMQRGRDSVIRPELCIELAQQGPNASRIQQRLTAEARHSRHENQAITGQRFSQVILAKCVERSAELKKRPNGQAKNRPRKRLPHQARGPV
jgi:hypothetical protein